MQKGDNADTLKYPCVLIIVELLLGELFFHLLECFLLVHSRFNFLLMLRYDQLPSA